MDLLILILKDLMLISILCLQVQILLKYYLITIVQLVIILTPPPECHMVPFYK